MIATAETINGKQMKQCQKCGKLYEVTKNFYKRRDGSYTDLDKKCLTLHIDNFKEDTFLWILKDIDVPYIPAEWNVIRNKEFAKNPNLTGMSVLGKYLSKMRIRQFSSYGWEDSEKLQLTYEIKKEEETREQKIFEEELKERYEAGDISEAEYKTLVSTPTQNQEYQESLISITTQENFLPESVSINQGNFFEENDDIDIELTDEEKAQLKLKWGRLYTKGEWVSLEKTYNDMMRSFDIQDADTINTLMFICKTKLKMDQALDSGDIEGFQKLSKTYNDLRKSAKFTAAQKKEEKEEFVDCVGNLVAYCEKEGGKIPKYEITTPLDIIDEVIDDLKTYTRDLIHEDRSLSKQIEDYLKKLEIAKQHEQDLKEAKAQGQDNIIIDIQDYDEYHENIDQQLEQDNLVYSGYNEVDE